MSTPDQANRNTSSVMSQESNILSHLDEVALRRCGQWRSFLGKTGASSYGLRQPKPGDGRTMRKQMLVSGHLGACHTAPGLKVDVQEMAPSLAVRCFKSLPSRALGGSTHVNFLACTPCVAEQLRSSAATCRFSISSPSTLTEAPSDIFCVLDGPLLSIDLLNNITMIQDASIIQYLHERSQLCLNLETYSAKDSKVPGFADSLLVYVIQEMEKSHAKAGRYKWPTEIPFFPDILLEPLIPAPYPSILHQRSASINLNKEIWQLYFEKILPMLAKDGKDGHNGSSAVCDAQILQALSKRIHYGMYLAEAKFSISPEKYELSIKKQDADKLRNLLTDSEEEGALKRREQFRTEFSRVLMKSGASTMFNLKVKPELVVQLFNECIIPMSMEVQIQYLLLKGSDDILASSCVREIIRLNALSRSRLLVKAEPSLAFFTKIAGVLAVATIIALRDKIFELLKAKGLVSKEMALAAAALFLVTKEVIEVLKRGKEYTELIRYYLKFWEKDKKG